MPANFPFRPNRSEAQAYARQDENPHPRRILAAWSGVIQADAYSGYNALYAAERKPAPVIEAACWSHGGRDFFHLAKLGKSPSSVEVVRRIDEVFAIERAINGASVDTRLAIRQERSKPPVAALEAYTREQLRRLSSKNDVAKRSDTC